MATRLTNPKLATMPAALAPANARAAAGRVAAWRPPSGVAGREFAWRALWLPFWLGSDVPAPRLPARDSAAVPAGPAGDHVVAHLSRLSRRIWLQRTLSILTRALWLPLLVGCVWLMLELLGGPEVRMQVIVVISIVCLCGGAIFAAFSRPTRRHVARMLDRSFDLHDRMSTAVENLGVEVPAPGERARITYLQMADAANVATELRGHAAFKIRIPVRELVLGIACGLLLAALFFLRGANVSGSELNLAPVPKFVPAAELMAKEAAAQSKAAQQTANAPTLEDVNEQASKSADAQRDLQTLAKALKDTAVTRRAADAINSGDYEGATEALQNASEQADQWTEQSRTNLADDLEQAASTMSETNPSLAEAASEAAEGLREGGEAAKSGVSELADAVEQAAQDVIPQSQLASDRQRAEAASAESSSDSRSGQDSEQSGETQAAENQEEGAGNESDSQPGTQGEGADASESSDANGESSSETADGASEGEGAGQQSDAQSGQSGEASEGAESEGNSDSAGGGQSETGQEGGQPGSQPNADSQAETDNSASGSTGGKGESGSEENSGANAAGDASQPTDPNVTNPEATDGGAAGETNGATTDPRQAIELSGGQSDGSVQTSGDGPNSADGTGSGGTSFNAGTSVQGQVGEAGPDSNRVPADYRSVVEAYFSDPTER